MIRTTLYLLLGFVIYNATNGPLVNLFSEPRFIWGIPDLYLWNILMQFFAVGWVIYGLKRVPFIGGIRKKEEG